MKVSPQSLVDDQRNGMDEADDISDNVHDDKNW